MVLNIELERTLLYKVVVGKIWQEDLDVVMYKVYIFYMYTKMK